MQGQATQQQSFLLLKSLNPSIRDHITHAVQLIDCMFTLHTVQEIGHSCSEHHRAEDSCGEGSRVNIWLSLTNGTTLSGHFYGGKRKVRTNNEGRM